VSGPRGALTGISAFATHRMKQEMEKLDIPPVGEFIEMIADAGGHLYACKATVDMFPLTKDDFVPQVERVLTVGDFYELAAGGQIIFTWDFTAPRVARAAPATEKARITRAT